MQQLRKIAKQLGIEIKTRPLHQNNGEYCHAAKAIYLRPGMTYTLERSVLAHELGHAVNGDQPTNNPYQHARQETRADQWAATALITQEQYQAAEQTHDGHIGAIASELQVIPRLIHAYQQTLSKQLTGAI